MEDITNELKNMNYFNHANPLVKPVIQFALWLKMKIKETSENEEIQFFIQGDNLYLGFNLECNSRLQIRNMSGYIVLASSDLDYGIDFLEYIKLPEKNFKQKLYLLIKKFKDLANK